ncbi:hypothetical protein Terro_1585 [Terriglobus roseus DSM 18391]|uniref:Uncharacterized protein n=1 Tax=Terriglobus roseus (strain DSM 18391 / NRRL B-41598 / KBS 63) TaxID=926566 RepID=I3ZF73_TERRK|nr:hypothetical protein [Terriglobus roseus]AFL87891.1 hypothetical protein Terro_1585 [Terriglobus roseus DSM 18391]
MNYQERTLYGTLIADLLVYVLYLWHPAKTNSLGWIAGSILVLIVAQIIVQSAIAIRTRNLLQDERDLLIRLRGYRAGYLTFVICIVSGLGLLWMHEAFGRINPNRMGIHFLSVMFGMLIVADVVRVVTQLIDYRRAA